MPNRARTHSGVASQLDYRRARYANLALGVWLMASAFIWPHYEVSRANTGVVGLLICVSSLAARGRSSWRWANTALAAWLCLSTLLLIRPLWISMVWNNLLVAGLVFALSLVADTGTAAGRSASRRAEAEASPASSRHA